MSEQTVSTDHLFAEPEVPRWMRWFADHLICPECETRPEPPTWLPTGRWSLPWMHGPACSEPNAERVQLWPVSFGTDQEAS